MFGSYRSIKYAGWFALSYCIGVDACESMRSDDHQHDTHETKWLP